MKYIFISTGPVYDKKPTGGMRRFKELSEYYNRINEDVTICGTDRAEDVEAHGLKHYIRLNERSKSPVLKQFPPIIGGINSNKMIYLALKKQKPDRVIIFDVMNTVGPALLGFSNIVLMVRKDLIGYERLKNKSNFVSRTLKLSFQWLCESICMMRSRMIICQCIYDREILRYRHPLLSKKIAKKTVIQINNVNPFWIEDKSQKIDSLTLGQTDKFRVCFIGEFDNPRKGQDLLLASAAQILKSHQDVEFVFVGGGRALEAYKEKYNNPSILFVGWQDNPISILKECSLLVVPSLADSCPNTVMEALYNGIPVIGSRAGGIPEILVDEESLFDLKHTEITKKILQLKEDRDYLSLLISKQAKRREELTFDWAEAIASIISNN